MTTEPDDVPIGAPLDLVLTDAARHPWRRFGPSASTAKALLGVARDPVPVARRVGGLVRELGAVVAGSSDVAPAPRDRRFADEAWRTNPLLRRVMQGYLAAADAALDVVDHVDLEPHDALRVHAGVSNWVDALAPSNNPLLNPTALKAVVDTAGANLVRGARHLARDLATPPRVPRMVEPDAFVVGKTVAATPGHVVARTEQFELLQYTPTTPTVRRDPLLVVPPVINKFYVVDMAPGRSLVEYLVGEGHQVFVMSWRNPDARHSAWDLDVYGGAVIAALDATRAVTGAPRTLTLSLCSGGTISSMVLAHLAATGRLDVIGGAALSVSVLDQSATGLTGELLTPNAAEAAVRASAARGYLDGRTLAEVFAWLRPNDLVWNYWVESYLLGRSPKPFDVLFWNSDTTRMTAGLHRDFIELSGGNTLVRPGGATMLGTPVDLGAITVDSYVTAGTTDHICPWQGCYATTRLYGGTSRFVLSSAGHVASIVNPPSNPKATRLVADDTPDSPDEWFAKAEKVQGSWWPDFSAWLHERSGDLVPAPDAAGSTDHPALGPAPGTYVHAP
ncbi:PHA/PHB synthase family protein [Actinomycetospora sp. CA-084318]|uniref:PHA/PHB synthase family protein n=1 Tax=Actinomycetospora sp. CA-084318 TaxID=3239892 RepID=UPI003D99BE5B